MKNILLLLLSIVMFSCSTQKVLKTDTRQDIDLSGRWNHTDAEIATNELFNSLMSSSWFKNFKSDNNRNVRIEVQEFESNFKSDKSLEIYFKEYINANQLLELIEEDGAITPDFQLSGNMNAQEFVSEEQKYIDYILIAKIQDLKGETLWEENTTVKKYIKDR